MNLINSRKDGFLRLVINFLVIEIYCSSRQLGGVTVTAQAIISSSSSDHVIGDHNIVVPQMTTDYDTFLTKLKSELAKGGLMSTSATINYSHPRLYYNF